MRNWMRIVAVVVIAPPGAALPAQTPGVLSFEVASVKPNPTGRGPLGILPGGRFVAPNVSLRTLVRAAYGLEPYEVAGGAAWIDSATFEIDAVTGSVVAVEDVRSMLKSLLAERFKLAVHIERRTLPVYSLTSTWSARLPPGRRPSAQDCATVVLPAGVPIPPPPPAGAAQVIPLMPGVRFRCPSVLFPGHMSIRQITLSEFAARLTQVVGRPVLDRTGLNGSFDIDLVYAPEGPASIRAVDAPSIFTALQEQLGLKLQSEEAPINVLVIDSAQAPSSN